MRIVGQIEHEIEQELTDRWESSQYDGIEDSQLLTAHILTHIAETLGAIADKLDLITRALCDIKLPRM